MACAWLVACGPARPMPPAALRGRVDAASVGQRGAARAQRLRLARDDQRRAAVRRRRGAVRAARRTRATRARPAVELEACADPRRARALRAATSTALVLDARPTVRGRASPTCAPARRRGGRLRPLPSRARRAPRPSPAPRPPSAAAPTASSWPAACANRLLLEATAAALERAACGCSSPSACRRTTAAISYGQARGRRPRRRGGGR